MTLTDVTDADVEIRCIEPENFDCLVARHQRRIYRILLGLVRDADVADTLTQECFLRAFVKRGSFRAESSLSTWLVRIALNLAHDHNRSRRWAFWRRLEHSDAMEVIAGPDARQSPEQVLLNRERMHEIRAAVNSLSDRQKVIFLLRYVEEMPLEEIARAMELKLGTVKSHLYRAVESVRAVCGGFR
jgi:RNA polymerase sigma-70 factor (ECF subfamily)